MGRTSRLKPNPKREHRQRDRDAKARAARSRSPGHYVGDPSRSFEDIVHAAAMHEAGHIVSGLALGFSVSFAILRVQESRKRSGGYTEVRLDFLGEQDSAEEACAAAMTPEALRVRTMQALAGRLAESLVNTDGDDIDKGAEDDDRQAMQFAMVALGLDENNRPKATTEELAGYLNVRQDEMFQVLKPLAGAIIDVANCLIAHPNEEVPGDTLKKLIDSHQNGA